MDLEAYYVDYYCNEWGGVIEYRLPNRTRVDCLTETSAIEFDWCKKWAEGIGQALYYAASTGKTPTLVLICRPTEERFVKRAETAAPEIRVIVVPKE